MRAVRVIVLVAASIPLAGCFGITLPPQPLPDWAMSPQAETAVSTRTKAVRRVPVRRAPDQTADVPHMIPASAPQVDVLPFSAQWQAREEALDNRLRRTMDICRGC
jgi:hypothetical protein